MPKGASLSASVRLFRTRSRETCYTDSNEFLARGEFMDIALMIEGQNGLNWPRWQRLAEAVEQ
ncbi:MAG: hypothetical protein J2P36_23080, partial [Ktedonobacteraceae bacterium]|nr:hypothetical protein [Ktedonobacteraceae bacterium]